MLLFSILIFVMIAYSQEHPDPRTIIGYQQGFHETVWYYVVCHQDGKIEYLPLSEWRQKVGTEQLPNHRGMQYAHGWIYSPEWGYVVEIQDTLNSDYYFVPDFGFVVEGTFKMLDYDYTLSVMVAFENDDGEYIGILHYGTNKLFFIGHMEESAKLFFEFLKPYIDEYIREELEEKK